MENTYTGGLMHIGTHHITHPFHRKKVILVYLWNGCVPMEGMCIYEMGVYLYGRECVPIWKGLGVCTYGRDVKVYHWN